jgi:hypothetical protein
MSELLCVDDLASRLNTSRWNIQRAIDLSKLQAVVQPSDLSPRFSLAEVSAKLTKVADRQRLLLVLHLMKLRWEDTTFDAVMGELQAAIRRVTMRIDKASETASEEFMKDIYAEEISLIESIAGSAFVVAQTYLTAVVSSAIRLVERVPSGVSVALPTNKSGTHKMQVGPANTNGYTPAEYVNAFANYFKHRDEWPYHWASSTGLTKQQQDTVRVITAFGATEGASANLCTGLSQMGYPDYAIVRMGEDLQEWCRQLHSHYHMALTNAGLI